MKLFTELDLRRRATPTRFKRGRVLAKAIDYVDEDDFSLCATVDDRQPWLAMIHHRAGPLSSECDCPHGAPGGFCEHSVAVGLWYLADDDR